VEPSRPAGTAGTGLAGFAATRREQLQQLRRELNQRLRQLDQAVSEQAEQRAGTRLLLSHPGVDRSRRWPRKYSWETRGDFPTPKRGQLRGHDSSEHSSGGKQRNGSLSKQGNPLLRLLWVEAARAAARKDARLKQFYRKKLVQKGLGKAGGGHGAKAGHSAVDHDARPDRLHRVLPAGGTTVPPCGNA